MAASKEGPLRTTIPGPYSRSHAIRLNPHCIAEVQAGEIGGSDCNDRFGASFELNIGYGAVSRATVDGRGLSLGVGARQAAAEPSREIDTVGLRAPRRIHSVGQEPSLRSSGSTDGCSAKADGASRSQDSVGCQLWREMAFGGNEPEVEPGGARLVLPSSARRSQ